MKLTCIETGAMRCNNYLLANEDTGEGVLIDCGGSGEEVVRAARQFGVRICAILLTHGHADHIEGIDHVSKIFSCPVYLHRQDLAYLTRADYNLSMRIYGRPLSMQTQAIPVEDGEYLEFAGLSFEVIHTPGHTDGCVCYRCGEMLFTGDTLFRNSVGGDFPPFGNLKTELESIQKRLFTLDDHVCYPGHGESTTLSYEIKNNMYCRD